MLLRCEMQTLIGPIAITTIMLMCILTMHNAFVVQRCHMSHSVRICNVYKIILKS